MKTINKIDILCVILLCERKIERVGIIDRFLDFDEKLEKSQSFIININGFFS